MSSCLTGCDCSSSSSPAYGHLLPLLPMIRAAMAAGHDVRLATGPDLVRPMRARSVPAYGVGSTWGEISAERDEEARRSNADDLYTQRVVSAGMLFGRRRPGGCQDLLDLAGAGDRTSSCTPLELGGVMLAGTSACPA